MVHLYKNKTLSLEELKNWLTIMQSSYSKELSCSFAVDESSLKKIIKLLIDRIGEVSISIDCADDVTRQMSSTAQLFNFENPKDKKIQKLHLVARSVEEEKRVSIKWSSIDSRGIFVDIEARDDVVVRLKSDLLDIISGMKLWYEFYGIVEKILFGMLILISIYFSFHFAIIDVEHFNKEPPYSPFKHYLAWFLITFTCPLWLAIYIAMRSLLLPKGVFLVGQGISRYKTLEKVQWSVLVGFFISFAAGIPWAILNLS